MRNWIRTPTKPLHLARWQRQKHPNDQRWFGVL